VLSEITRKEQGNPSRRKPVELATVAWWPPAEASELAPLLRKALRVTDVITSNEDGLRVLLMGCDELGAVRALQRVPTPPSWVRLATSTEVLCGVTEDDLR
jgi:hypothetical protein